HITFNIQGRIPKKKGKSQGRIPKKKQLLKAARRSRTPPSALAYLSSSPAAMTPQGKSSSLERLHDVEQRIVRVVELSGAVMEELGNSQGPRAEAVAAHCREFMLYMKGNTNNYARGNKKCL
uniref:Mediator complex subunit 11 n=1 Tax=Aegilops tauschii subsp. strangulata TaxID=200361 RepID=A0A453NNV0_AEGTS